MMWWVKIEAGEEQPCGVVSTRMRSNLGLQNMALGRIADFDPSHLLRDQLNRKTALVGIGG